MATGEPVAREVPLPGAVLARVASSHLHVGDVPVASVHGDTALLQQLADLAIERHHPAAADAANPYVALFEAVCRRPGRARRPVDARRVRARRHELRQHDDLGGDHRLRALRLHGGLRPGHGVQLDRSRRPVRIRQPARIAQWNLARLGEALLPLFAAELEPAVEAANGVLASFAAHYDEQWLAGIRAKLGLASSDDGDAELAAELLSILEAQRVDMTLAFRALSSVVRGDNGPVRGLLADGAAFDEWTARWRRRIDADGRPADEVAQRWTG